MRGRRWAGLAASAVTAAALTAIPATTASAATQTLNITVGGDQPVSGVLLEGMRFLAPQTIQVHKGDTINFGFAGFHTATLLPEGVGADDWRMDNQAGLDSPYSLVNLDADDATNPPTFQFNKAVLFPTDQSCGTATNPCAFDGKNVLNSGVPITAQSFAATINNNPGSTFWVVCLIHPDMQFRVQVVADNETATTQGDINSSAARTQDADREAAAALIPLLNKPSSHKAANGTRVWDAYAGFDGDGWGLDGMFPKRLVVQKGDTVRWHFTQLMGNIHTVTFPRTAAKDFNHDFAAENVKCEADPADTPPDAAPPQFCSSGPQNLEFEIRGGAVLPVGTHTYRGTGIRSSGVEGADAPSQSPYDLKFAKRSGKKGFPYACNVHGGMMRGKVVVK